MLVVEFHCHTHFSKDSLARPQDLIRAAHRKGVDRLVITDHNSISGALEAKALDPTLVIVGEEIMTTQGEILAAFVQEEIPAFLSPMETIGRLREQGALISVSHPFDTMRAGGWQLKDLEAIVPLVDAIEVYNSRCMMPQFNRLARDFADKNHLAGTVGSDAHAVFEVGRSVVVLDPFSDAEGMRNVIRRAKFRVRWSPWWFHLTSRYAATVQQWGLYARS